MFTNAWYLLQVRYIHKNNNKWAIHVRLNILKILFQIGDYEALPTEPFHDVKEHIANVLTELPSHLEKEETKKAFLDIIECSFAGKEKLRGCDYRLAAVIVAQYVIVLQTRADLTIIVFF